MRATSLLDAVGRRKPSELHIENPVPTLRQLQCDVLLFVQVHVSQSAVETITMSRWAILSIERRLRRGSARNEARARMKPEYKTARCSASANKKSRTTIASRRRTGKRAGC